MSKAATSILKYCVDQIHKQLIDWRRNHAGIVENLNDLHTIRHHQVVCLELARLVRELEGTDNSDEQVHHEQYPKLQSDYKSEWVHLTTWIPDIIFKKVDLKNQQTSKKYAKLPR